MKFVVNKRKSLIVPVMTALLIGGGVQGGILEPMHAQAQADKPARAARPKSKVENGTIAEANTTQVKVTTKGGDVTTSLLPTTEYWRVEEDLPASELKTGDTVRLALKGTNGMPTVQSVAPLTLKFGDAGTLTLTQTDKMTFDRVSKIAATDLTVGQQAKITNSVHADGKIEAREVWVVVERPKAAKKPKA